jgi:hypothetical protein
MRFDGACKLDPRLRGDDVFLVSYAKCDGLHALRMSLISHYEIEYHILKIACSTGRIDTLYSRDSLFATKRPG